MFNRRLLIQTTETKSLISTYRDVQKEKRKVDSQISPIEEGILAADVSNRNLDTKKAKLSDRLVGKEAALEKRRTTIYSGLEIWKKLGLQVEKLSPGVESNVELDSNGDGNLLEGNFELRFTNVDQNAPGKVYMIKITITNNKIKGKFVFRLLLLPTITNVLILAVFEAVPKNFLSFSDILKIETDVNGDDLKDGCPLNFRFLAVSIRRHIKESIIKLNTAN